MEDIAWAELLNTVVEGRGLSAEKMTAAMEALFSGTVEAPIIAAFLTALRAKGESVDELSAALAVMRRWMTPVPVSPVCHPLVDTCGTGGDGAGLFNVSTTVSFVVAAAGAYVVKHGNRAQSGKSGSADVLEHLGVKIDLTPASAADCLEKTHMTFLFAPHYHLALRHVAPIRKLLKIRTLFNLLGPLANPAKPPFQVIGVFSAHWLEPLAQVLNTLGSQHVLLVHSDDGLDEISPAAATTVVELKNGLITRYKIHPQDFQLPVTPLAALQVQTVAESAQYLLETLAGRGAGQTVVALNAGAALYASGIAATLQEGVALASQTLAAQGGLAVFEHLRSVSQRLGQ